MRRYGALVDGADDSLFGSSPSFGEHSQRQAESKSERGNPAGDHYQALKESDQDRPYYSRTPWEELQRSLERRWHDVNVVMQNFLGDRGFWEKFPELNAQNNVGEGQREPEGWCTRFQNEMLEGTEFYSRYQVGDQIALGLAALVYSPFYLVMRVATDGLTNIQEYLDWRRRQISDDATVADNARRTNSYVLGVPVSLVFIPICIAAEVAVRVIGISQRSARMMAFGADIAGFLLQPWTGEKYHREDFTDRWPEWHSVDFSKGIGIALFNGALNIADAFGTVLIGIPVAIVIAALGLSFTAIRGLYEILKRGLGFTKQGASAFMLAIQGAGWALQHWIGEGNYQDAALEVYEKGMEISPNTPWFWRKVDGFGVVVASVVGIVVTLLGITVAAGLGVLESVCRAAGISERSLSTLKYMWAFCRNIFGFQDPQNFSENKAKVSAPVDSWWTAMDWVGSRLGMIVSAALMILPAILSFVGLNKANYHRFLSFIHGLHNSLWKFFGWRLSRREEYGHEVELHIAENTAWGKFFSHVNLLNGIGQLVKFASTRLIMPLAEIVVRGLGISARGEHMYQLGLNAFGYFLQRWTKKEYDGIDWDEHSRAAWKASHNHWGWDAADAVGVVISGAIALAMGVVAAAFAVGAFLLEISARSVGFSDRTRNMYRYMSAVWGNIFGVPDPANFVNDKSPLDAVSWVGAGIHCVAIAVPVSIFSSLLSFVGLNKANYHRFFSFFENAEEALQAGSHTQKLQAAESTLLGNIFSHFNLLNIAVQLLKFAFNWVVFPVLKFIGRAFLGISARGAHMYRLGVDLFGYFFQPWKYTKEDFMTHLNAADQKSHGNAWDFADEFGALVSGGIAVLMGAVGAVLSFSVRIMGFSDRTDHMYDYLWQLCGKILGVNKKPLEFINEKSAWDPISCFGAFLHAVCVGIPCIVVSGIVSLVFRGFLGVSARGRSMYELGLDAFGYFWKRWTGAKYSESDFYTPFMRAATASHNSNLLNLLDFVGVLVSGGIAIGMGIVGATTAFVFGVGESVGRCLGVSERSLSTVKYLWALCGNLLGFQDPKNFEENKTKVLAPFNSWWKKMDTIGCVLVGIVSVPLMIFSGILSFVGFNKANYHRFLYSYHENKNDLAQLWRRQDVDRTVENYHKAELQKCQSMTKLSVFNCLYGVAVVIKWAVLVTAMVGYGAWRVVRAVGCAVVSAVKKALVYNLADPIDRVHKCFADLKKVLDKSGRLVGIDNLEQLAHAARAVDQRTCAQKTQFNFFSGGRKIVSLGHSPEEKILEDLKNKFIAFVETSKNQHRRNDRDNSVDVVSFFSKDVTLENRKKFSYTRFVEEVKATYRDPEDKAAVDRIAKLIESLANARPNQQAPARKASNEKDHFEPGAAPVSAAAR